MMMSVSKIHAFSKRNASLKLAKNQANAKQHPDAKLLPSENYSHSLPTLSSKNNR